MSSCDNCKFTEWCKNKADDIRWCIEKSNLNNAYKQGRADVINVIKNDFHKSLTEKIKTLPKEPNGHSKVYDEGMMINIVESFLENYLSNIK